MTLDRLRPYVAGLLTPAIAGSKRLGLTPNFFSVGALVAAFAAGVAFYYGEVAWGVLLVAVNAVFDALDGALARELEIASLRGDFIDHVSDRYADIVIITGIFAGGAASWQVGVFALTGVLMSSYMGTQAQALGVGRYYGGILGRADRLVLLIIAGVLDLVFAAPVYGMPYLGWLLVIFGVLGHYTALQRIVYIWKRL
ncbi:CDP-alcohol phosphatidyltransferase family protein [Methanofollis formosanus]|uniref:CDP-alcohol phosphatidyltransferase family protein n=1 Tax=Methanofollis formosanus TaxID=299308 RepID=A0A8G1A1U0_9EURY|nr:CDP-alcohol phosphatidyltransferase family protein [Methanofollis formosanus]QYZ78537.1 CDP-alcohol phosphatidyltransferase family protein [Methanofollis formosanus]